MSAKTQHPLLCAIITDLLTLTIATLAIVTVAEALFPGFLAHFLPLPLLMAGAALLLTAWRRCHRR